MLPPSSDPPTVLLATIRHLKTSNRGDQVSHLLAMMMHRENLWSSPVSVGFCAFQKYQNAENSEPLGGANIYIYNIYIYLFFVGFFLNIMKPSFSSGQKRTFHQHSTNSKEATKSKKKGVKRSRKSLTKNHHFRKNCMK